MSNVLPLPVPKTITGTKRNASWRISYNPINKMWRWEVHVTLSPQVFSGEAATQAEAQEEVKRFLPTKQ